MIQVNLKNGSTTKFDLSTESGQMGWHDFCADPSVPNLVSGLGIHQKPQSFIMPISRSKDIVVIGGGVLVDHKRNKVSGEFVWYKTNKFQITQTVYTGDHKLSKVEIEEI